MMFLIVSVTLLAWSVVVWSLGYALAERRASYALNAYKHKLKTAQERDGYVIYCEQTKWRLKLADAIEVKVTDKVEES